MVFKQYNIKSYLYFNFLISSKIKLFLFLKSFKRHLYEKYRDYIKKQYLVKLANVKNANLHSKLPNQYCFKMVLQLWSLFLSRKFLINLHIVF